MEGAAYYYYDIPKNPVNDWLIAENKKRFNGRRRISSPAAVSSRRMAVVEALKKTNGSTDTEKLIAAMEGMAFETPKGTMIFRKEDHQADAAHVRLQDQGRPERRLGDPRTDPRDHQRRDEDTDQQQAP